MESVILICRILLLFFAYGFLGWCVESVYCSLNEGRLINRGFLTGPICPVYAFGAMAVVFLLMPFRDHLFLLYVMGLVLVSIIEYITGWLLETLFHAKWWDYSDRKYHLHGRICLGNAIVFGILAVVAMHVIYPFLMTGLERMSWVWTIWMTSAFTTLFILDLIVSVRTALRLAGKLDALDRHLSKIRTRTETVMSEKRLQAALFLQMTPEERMEAVLDAAERLQLLEKLKQLRENHTFSDRRILNAFPKMHFLKTEDSIGQLKQAIAQKRKCCKKSKS